MNNGADVICLIPARPDNQYWHEYIFPYAESIQFIKGRLHFSGSKEHAAFPSVIVRFKGRGKGFENLVYKSYEPMTND